MDVSTIHFFNSLLDEDRLLTCEGLKDALLERYGGQDEGNVNGHLNELSQKGHIEEYISELEYLISYIPKLLYKKFHGYFLHGLKGDIQGNV